MTPSHGEAETRFVRERASELLESRGYRRLADGFDDDRGWRAEFVRDRADDDAVVLAHKPDGAPYLTLGAALPCERTTDPETLHALIETASDFDVSFYFSEGRRGLLCLTSRLMVSGLARDDFHFQLDNLVAAREAVAGILNERDEKQR